MSTMQTCARWGCIERATYDKPLCYDHWREWQAWQLEECNRCHWVYGPEASIMYDAGGYFDVFPYLCDPCLWVTKKDLGQQPPWRGRPPETFPSVLAHAKIERITRYVYIMKLTGGDFYIGQTTNLGIRVIEHRDGTQSQTRGKEPRLLYFEHYEGDRDKVRERENELTKLNQTPTGRRRLREMIEHFRTPLRLLDLDA